MLEIIAAIFIFALIGIKVINTFEPLTKKEDKICNVCESIMKPSALNEITIKGIPYRKSYKYECKECGNKLTEKKWNFLV